jgi:pimeloyl-ACP methyl ester carboxylesterase
VPLHSGEDLLPVVLVPGIMGSTAKSLPGGLYPRLPATWANPDNLQLHDPLKKAGWRDLKKILTEQKGLAENITLIDCPYDWRVPLDTAVSTYLLPAIRQAQGGDPTKKVNIIAHSMGGLLVRAFIQKYPDSAWQAIANFSMVGTPNKGSANAYYLWEGGDPKEADDLGDKYNEHYYENIVNFYFTTTALQMMDSG